MSKLQSSFYDEQAVLGACFYRDTAFGDARRLLGDDPAVFGCEEHQAIFRAFLAIDDRAGPTSDPLVLAAQLKTQDEFDLVGGMSYLGELASVVPTDGNLEHYAAHVRNSATKRVLADVAQRLKYASRNGVDPSEAASDALDRLGKLAAPRHADGRADVRSLLTTPAPPAVWAFEDLIPKRAVVAVDAMGGTGKSMFLLQLALSAASGHTLLDAFRLVRAMRVLAIFAEEPQSELHRRIQRIRNAYPILKDLDDRIESHLRLHCGQSFPLIDADSKPTSRYTWLRREIVSFKPDIIILDPRAFFAHGNENDNAHVAAFMSRLSELCQLGDEGVTLMLAHHVAKAHQDSLNSASGRGASAARDACRVVFNMAPATREQAAEIGRPDPQNFVWLSRTKSNWTAGESRRLLLQRSVHPEYPGVLFEADERSLRDEAERARLDPIAQHIAQYVCENPDNLTIRDWAERTAGKELRDELKAIFGDSVTCKCVGAAFEQAVRLNLVTFDEVRTGPGRPKRVPRQRRTSDDGASAT